MKENQITLEDIENEKKENAIKDIEDLANKIVNEFKNGNPPQISIPSRTKSNIEYDENKKVWKLGDKHKERTGSSVKGARNLSRLSEVLSFLRHQIEEDRSSTLREIYYLSENWEKKFKDQDESDRAIEELELITGKKREEFNLRPEEDGATVVGDIRLRENTKRGRELHLQEDVGEGGYQIPTKVDSIEFLECNAEFVIAVETGGMRDRLIENRFDKQENAVIVHLKGQPARATRRLIKKLNNDINLPIFVFTDGDPWSYRIFASVSYGSINSAHLVHELATPESEFIGVQPSDIVEYDLPTDPLSESDIKALENELKDPRFGEDEYWKEQIELQLELGKKSEQQALAKHGLDFVTDTYLPEKLSDKL